MNRKAASFILGFALALLLGGGLWWLLSGRRHSSGPGSVSEPAAQPAQKVGFQIYFPADGGVLRAESREIEVSESPRQRIRKILEALLAGPKAPGLARPFPEGVVIGGVLLGKDGTTYVDLRWPDHDEPPAGGSTEEIQRIYSVVDSISLNVPQATRVVLLWNGVQRDTFSGHLDLSRPLVADPSLVAR